MGRRWRRPHSNLQELEAWRSWCLLAVRGLQRLPPGLLGVSGEQPRAAVCYPTLQKMLLHRGGKDTKQLPFNYSVAGASWGPGWSQRKILAEASCNRTTWAGAKVGAWGRERQPGVCKCWFLSAVPWQHASRSLSSPVHSRAFCPTTRAWARAWLDPYTSASVYAIKQG